MEESMNRMLLLVGFPPFELNVYFFTSQAAQHHQARRLLHSYR